jgi:hypothetical protein
MLLMSKQMNNELQEVNMHTPPPLARLVRRDLLRTLMERTGDGTSVSVRDLAAAAYCTKSTVGALLTGEQLSVAVHVAEGIVGRLGVDFLVLFAPEGRTTAAHDARPTPACAVSA